MMVRSKDVVTKQSTNKFQSPESKVHYNSVVSENIFIPDKHFQSGCLDANHSISTLSRVVTALKWEKFCGRFFMCKKAGVVTLNNGRIAYQFGTITLIDIRQLMPLPDHPAAPPTPVSSKVPSESTADSSKTPVKSLPTSS